MAISAMLVGGAMAGCSPDVPVRPAGVAALRLQAMIEQTVASVGGRVSSAGCTMMGNVNLGVTCKVDGLSRAALREALLKEGWQPTPGPPLASEDKHSAFVREGDHLSFDSSSEGVVRLVSARQRKS